MDILEMTIHFNIAINTIRVVVAQKYHPPVLSLSYQLCCKNEEADVVDVAVYVELADQDVAALRIQIVSPLR